MAAPIWGKPKQGGFGSGASGGFGSAWEPRGGSVSTPPTFAPPSEVGATPGTYGINPMDPVGSAEQVAEETGGLLRGLKMALFGSDVAQRDEKGELKHGGLIGDIPIAGDITRFAGGGIATAGDALLGATGGLLERVPLPTPGAAVEAELVKQQYEAIPQEFRDKFMAESGVDKGLFGTGLFSNELAKMSQAVRAYEEEKQLEDPDLFRGLITPSGSIADSVTNLLGALGAGQRLVERGIAGAAKPQTGGVSRLEEIMRVGKGETAFAFNMFAEENASKLLPVEQLVFDKVSSGEWSQEDGLDYLASHGSGLSHVQWLQIAGTFATDPLTVGSLGAAGLAKAGVSGVSILTNLERAQGALKAAQATGDAAKIAEATNQLALARAVTVVNVGGARANAVAKGGLQAWGKVYQTLDGTATGRIAKASRFIIDPLHAVELRMPQGGVELYSDAIAKAGTVAYGRVNYLRTLETMHDINPSLYDQVVDNLSVYYGNVGRRVAAIDARNSVLASAEADLPGFMAQAPGEVAERTLKGWTRKKLNQQVMEEVNRHRIHDFDGPAMDNLATRMEKMYGVNTADEWKGVLSKMNTDQLSLLHASTYGKAQDMLLSAVAIAAREGSGMSDKLQRLILLNRDTLTTLGADGILDDIAKAGGDEAELARIIKAAQVQYPELGYFSFEAKNAQRSAERFAKWLDQKKPHLPMQVTDDEAKTFHPNLQELGDQIDGAYTLGFSPEDEFKWGMQRVNEAEGAYAPVGDVWVDHVGREGVGPGYRAGRYLDTNFAGKPIVGLGTGKRNLGRIVVKPIDYMEAGLRTLTTSVSGHVIAESAAAKFASRAQAEYGMTKAEGTAILEALQEHVGATATIANPRGMSPQSMWQVAQGLVPTRLAGQVTQRDILKLVLDAYEGDIRFVGATQKFTGAAKRVVGERAGVNYLGQLAEHVYPLIKFRLNPIFQAQEKIEPWVLNAQRGAMVRSGATAGQADLILQRSLERMTKYSLTRMGDMADQFEYSAQVLFGKKVQALSAQEFSQVKKIAQLGRSLTDVQGTKRISMLSTFKKGLGKELKQAWDEAYPDRKLWDEMKGNAQLKQGKLLSDDDFAVQVIAEQQLANDVVVQRVVNLDGTVDYVADFKGAIAPGKWASPGHLGEVRPLELDTMTELLGWSTSKGVIKGQGELRAAIAAGEKSIDDIEDALFRHGADPDYVRRVRNALEFSWEGFWAEAAKRYNLTRLERLQLEDFVGRNAELRGLTPVDYASQVWSPVIQNGMEGGIGELGKAVEVMRGGKLRVESALGQFAAPVDEAGKYIGQRDDFVTQLSRMFSSHLDPSAKKALLVEFKPELKAAIDRGELALDQTEVLRMWEQGGDDALARSIIDGMNASEGDLFEAQLRDITAEAFNAEFPGRARTVVSNFTRHKMKVESILGPGLMNADPAIREPIVRAVYRIKKQFPEFDLAHVDIVAPDELLKWDPGAVETQGLTTGTRGDNPAVFLSSDYLTPEGLARMAKARAINEARGGVHDAVNLTPDGLIYHELGHAVLERVMAVSPAGSRKATQIRAMRKYAALNEFFESTFPDSPAAHQLSKYTGESVAEAQAELFDAAFNPETNLSRFPAEAPPPTTPAFHDPDMPIGSWGAEGPQTVQEAIDQVRSLMKDAGLWKEPPPTTVNPDIIRAHRMFARWTDAVVRQGLTEGDQATHAGLLHTMAAMPTEGAVPYNLTEARLLQATTEAMQRKWVDAYRLQYFAQSRSVLERSVNHPMFGIYPVSYMWGKLMPEVVQFMAQRPFGVRTGSALYVYEDIQKAVALQREFDPEFDEMMEKLGHSQVMWFLGYMLPTLPWDVGASWPAWMRDLADQGLTMEGQVARGQAPDTPDVYRSFTKSMEVINPLRPFKQAHSAAKEFDETILNPQQEEGGNPWEAYQAQQNRDPLEGPVKGADTGNILTDALAQLSELLR